MSGHSKWSKVKHQKAVTDVVRASAFTKASRAITMAVREGGGTTDPQFNFKLRLAIEKAKYVNMPKENIERAVLKGNSQSDNNIEAFAYEAYGPGSTALLISALTDNRTRTVSAVKNILDRHGGKLGTPGSVSFMFTQTGILVVPKLTKNFDDMFEAGIEGGADDVTEEGDSIVYYTDQKSLISLKNSLESKGYVPVVTQVIMKPLTYVNVSEADFTLLQALVQALEDLDDVQDVYTNAGEI